MRNKAFTLVEILLVIALIGLMIGATTWAFEGLSRSASHEATLNAVVRADRMMRLSARRLGKPRAIQFDLDKQTLREISDHPRDINISGCRVDRVVVQGSDENQATVQCTPAGTSPSYAVRLVGKDSTGWLVFCGLTGQSTWIQHENDTQNLLEVFGVRNDAR